jgi:hypothetical protein
VKGGINIRLSSGACIAVAGECEGKGVNVNVNTITKKTLTAGFEPTRAMPK